MQNQANIKGLDPLKVLHKTTTYLKVVTLKFCFIGCVVRCRQAWAYRELCAILWIILISSFSLKRENANVHDCEIESTLF